MAEFFLMLRDRLFPNRRRVLLFLMCLFSAILIARLFVLQIVRGQEYQSNYNLLVEKKQSLPATRGNIYDRNGNLLAYNELAYSVTLEDTYTSNHSVDHPNKVLNKEIATVITAVESYGDTVDNDFDIKRNADGTYAFAVKGTALQRFRADVFGRSRISDLEAENKYGTDEINASAEEIMAYLYGKHRFSISSSYDPALRYKIAVVRYKLSLNTYQKYIATDVATDVSKETAAFIQENKADLPGVDIKEEPIRKYTDGKYFAHIIGYTGKISSDEYKKNSKKDPSVERTDTVGKSGIEQYMNDYLAGKKGEETLYVDSLGNPISVTGHTDPTAGNDVYLSLDKDLQERAYNLLENEIAGILVSKIVDQTSVGETGSASDIRIPITDVYNALIQNNIIDRDRLKEPGASDVEKKVEGAYEAAEEEALLSIREEILEPGGKAFKDLDLEGRDYTDYILTFLKAEGILSDERIDKGSEVYKDWAAEKISLRDYLLAAIDEGWIDVTLLPSASKYVDTEEVYSALEETVLKLLPQRDDFVSLVYSYAIKKNEIRGNELSAILFDQGVIPKDDGKRAGLLNGSVSPYRFLLDEIRGLKITPGQLGLKPCSGSCVMIDPKTGAVLACVSYPGYDNNRLANQVDAAYYAYLNGSSSRPLYNNATQQRTAPGSTFKMLSSTAGLAEGVITTDTRIQDEGVFEKVSNKPHCWYYPNSHGEINVSEALRDSCNYFFYEVGWRLAGGTIYRDKTGIDRLKKYADLYGLTEKTGIETEENRSTYATKYPVMASIGQSDNNITTIALARYVTAVANKGTVYRLSLLDHVEDSGGKVIKTYGSGVKNQINILSPSQWGAIHTGMKMVVENLSVFDEFPVTVAGKTGTAQESDKAPNHALFVSFAPADDPRIACAVRIANGYTSSNAAAVSKDILGCYFNDPYSVSLADQSGALSLVSGPAGD